MPEYCKNMFRALTGMYMFSIMYFGKRQVTKDQNCPLYQLRHPNVGKSTIVDVVGVFVWTCGIPGSILAQRGVKVYILSEKLSSVAENRILLSQ